MEILAIPLLLAVAYFVVRWTAAGMGALVWFAVARAQQRTALRRTTFARYEPRDVGLSLLAFGVGGLIFFWSLGVAIAPPPVFHSLAPRPAPFGDRPAGDGPATYGGFFPGVTVSIAAPPFPAVAPDTLWVPFVTTTRRGRVRGGAQREFGEQRLECGFDLTRTGAPARCVFWVVASPEENAAPVTVRLDFDAGGVIAQGVPQGLGVRFGAAPVQVAAPDGEVRWTWAALGDRPRPLKSLHIGPDGAERRVDLDELALFAGRIVTARSGGARVGAVFDWRDKVRSASVYQRWGAGASDCLTFPFFIYWSDATRADWSSENVPDRPRTGPADFFTGAPPDALGDRCAAAGFALAWLDRLHIR